jgi:hypothetical protein
MAVIELNPSRGPQTRMWYGGFESAASPVRQPEKRSSAMAKIQRCFGISDGDAAARLKQARSNLNQPQCPRLHLISGALFDNA